MRRKIVWGLTSACGAGLCILFLINVRHSEETVLFRVVDKESGSLVTNAQLFFVERWIGLPLDRLSIPGLSQFRWKSVTNVGTGALVRFPKRQDDAGYMNVWAPSYETLHVFPMGPDGKMEFETGIMKFGRTNVVTIPLWREKTYQ